MSTYFDHVFVINLDRRPDRWRQAQEELRLCGLRAERFAAIEPPPEAGEGRAVVGCTASHRTIWRRIAEGDCGERVLVLEDDFMLATRGELLRLGHSADVLAIFDSCPGATFSERFEAMLPFVPESFDLLYLGGSYEVDPVARVNKHVIRNGGMHGAIAYCITRGFAAKLTEDVDRYCPPPMLRAGAPDSILAVLAKDPEVRSFTLSPRLFVQRVTVSDLNPQAIGFEWALTDSRHERMV